MNLNDTDCYPQTQFVTHRFTKSYANNCVSKGVNNVIVLTAKPVHIEPHRATMVLSKRIDVAEPEAPLGGMSSTVTVDLGNSSSSMI